MPMTHLSTRDQMTQKLTTIGHITAFNNDQRLCRLVSYKSQQNDKRLLLVECQAPYN